jgi:hypothetical protein
MNLSTGERLCGDKGAQPAILPSRQAAAVVFGLAIHRAATSIFPPHPRSAAQCVTNRHAVLAVISWLIEAWRREVGPLANRQSDAATALLALARGYAQMCRRDIARAPMALRAEFAGQPEHPWAEWSRSRTRRCWADARN